MSRDDSARIHLAGLDRLPDLIYSPLCRYRLMISWRRLRAKNDPQLPSCRLVGYNLLYQVSGSSVVVNEQQGRGVLELGSPSVPSKRRS